MINKEAVLTKNATIEVKSNSVEKLKDDECLVNIKFSGICSSDIYRGCDNGAYFYPLVMGHEFSGIVEKIGCNVKNFSIGDKVAIFPLLPCFKCKSCEIKKYAQCSDYKYYGSRNNGGFSNYRNINQWNLIKVNDIDLKDSCFVEPISVVNHAINNLELSADNEIKKMLVIGDGFLTSIFNEIIKLNYPNIEMSIIGRNQEKLNELNCNNTYLIDTDDKQKEFLKNNKFDYVVEQSGSCHMFKYAIDITDYFGTCLFIGNIDGDLVIDKKSVSNILRKEITIKGSWNSQYKNDLFDDWIESYNLIKNGLRPSCFVDHYISIDDLHEYLNKMYNHKIRKEKFKFTKVCVKM